MKTTAFYTRKSNVKSRELLSFLKKSDERGYGQTLLSHKGTILKNIDIRFLIKVTYDRWHMLWNRVNFKTIFFVIK